MKRMSLAVAGLVLSLSACGVTEGTVTDKVHEPERVEQQEIMEQECEMDTDTKMVNGKPKTTTEQECETVGTGEYEDVTIPATYTIVFENDEGDEGTDEVSESEFNEVEVGDFYKED